MFLFVALLASLSGASAIPLTIGLVLTGAAVGAGLVDAGRILADRLRPRDGEYFPRFFQTKPDAEPPTH